MHHGPGTLPAHPALEALAQVDAGLDGLGQTNLWSLTDADLLGLRVEIERTEARHMAVAAGRLTRADLPALARS